jgi:capsular polysaccharide synthesis protein
MDIWSAWLQGRSQAPEHVQRIFTLWEDLNPECTLHVLEDAEIRDILGPLDILAPRMTPQVITDLLRTHLLATRGGVWADSTLLPTRPLSDWLTDDLQAEGFFAFRSMGDPNLVVQNWFLFARSGNPLITAWRDMFFDYFSTPRIFPTWKRALWHGAPLEYQKFHKALKARDTLWFVTPGQGRDCRFYPYAVHNYNLAYLLSQRPDLQTLWDNVPKRWEALPRRIGDLAQDPETPQPHFQSAAEEFLQHAPVHKLSHMNPRFLGVVQAAEAMLRL